MRALLDRFLGQRPGLSFAVLGARDNRAALELQPWGLPLQWLAAEEQPDLVARYLALNRTAFSKLPLPAWVLTDLYLLPGALTLLRGPSALLEPEARAVAGESEQAILAAYYGAPSVVPGRFIGVSLFSFARGFGAGATTKALAMRVLGAEALRGVAQWDNPALRVHTRLGPLRVLGRAPGAHELHEKTFVYELSMPDDVTLVKALERQLELPVTERVPSTDLARLGAFLARAEQGEEVWLVPPGLDTEGRVLLSIPA